MKIKVGIIGFGLSGRYFHAPFLRENPLYELVGVSSSRPDSVHAYLPKAQVYPTPEAMIADPSIELIVNGGPNSVHFSLSKLALESGKHVVVEKPFVNSVTEAKELIDCAKKARRILCVFQNRRWDADFLTVQKLIREERFGEIMSFESNFDFYKPTLRKGAWREEAGPGSGTWCDLGAHLVDQMLTLFGKPTEVTADILAQRPGAQADDYFQVTFKYGNARVLLRSSLFAALLPRFRIYGDKGTFVKNGFDPQEPALRAGGEPSDPGFGVETEESWGTWMDPVAKTSAPVKTERGKFMEFYRLLGEAIQSGASEGPIPLADSLAVIEMIETARESSRLGKTLKI